jgi:hypothetical protein
MKQLVLISNKYAKKNNIIFVIKSLKNINLYILTYIALKHNKHFVESISILLLF